MIDDGDNLILDGTDVSQTNAGDKINLDGVDSSIVTSQSGQILEVICGICQGQQINGSISLKMLQELRYCQLFHMLLQVVLFHMFLQLEQKE